MEHRGGSDLSGHTNRIRRGARDTGYPYAEEEHAGILAVPKRRGANVQVSEDGQARVLQTEFE